MELLAVQNALRIPVRSAGGINGTRRCKRAFISFLGVAGIAASAMLSTLAHENSEADVRDMIAVLIAGFIVFAIALGLLYNWNQFVQEGFANALSYAETAAAYIPAGAGASPIGMDATLPTTSPAPAMSVTSELLLSDRVPVLNAAARRPMSTERCFESDAGEPLKPTRNYAQRTNNYRRSHPDDCSAPYQELIGTFYAPATGVGAVRLVQRADVRGQRVWGRGMGG
jgi:hypothetical protein